MGHIKVLICSIILMLCQQSLAFKENERVEIEFQYEFTFDADIKLRMGNREPFYEEGELVKTELTESQQKRFSVSVHHTREEKASVYTVLLQIEKVQREDSGTYRCEIFRDGQKEIQLTKKTHLRVDFPPGNVSCVPEVYKQFVDPDKVWTLLSCSALVGSEPVFVAWLPRW